MSCCLQLLYCTAATCMKARQNLGDRKRETDRRAGQNCFREDEPAPDESAATDAAERRGGETVTNSDPNREPDRDDRGRRAEHPQEISRAGWRDILLRVWQNLGRDNA